MWNKIYLAVFGVALFVMSFFTFYANSWLGSIGDPLAALAGYEFYAGLATSFLWISTVILLILANLLLWNTRRSWALWTSFAYFAIFVILRTFWLEKARFNFQNSDGFFFTPLVGVILIIVVGALVFFNQFLNLRLNERMYPIKEATENAEVEENEV